jgi:GNAT superfamily N-acetyltransferase
VSPNHQRKGIGAALMKRFTEVLDEKKAGCFLRASAMGRPLYEKFGWSMLGAFPVDLSQWGREELFTTWFMRREPVN